MQKKICIISGSYKSGGAEKVAIHLANFLSLQNSKVFLIVVLNEGKYKELISDRVNIIELGVQRLRYALPKLYGTFKSIKPDIVLSTQRQVNIITGPAAYVACKAKIVFREATTLDSLYQEPLIRRVWGKLVMFFSYLCADLIIANSKYTMNDLSRNVFCTSHKTIAIPNPVLPNKSKLIDDKCLPHKWLTNGNQTFLAVGRLHALKDFSSLIRAFKVASKDFSNMRLLIVGEGDERSVLEALINSLDLNKKVSMLGYRSDLDEFYLRAKALCLTSKWEGFGNVLVEAGALKCPLISADCPGGAPEILGFGEYGRMYEVGNIEALARALIDTVTNGPSEEELEKISKIFYSKYSIDFVAESYLSAIEG